MAEFTQEQTELITEKLLDIMTDGNSRMLSARNNLPDSDGSGMPLMLAGLAGLMGTGQASLSEEEIKDLRKVLVE